MRFLVLMAVVLALALPVASQAPTALFMEPDAATTNGADAQLLSPDAPTGTAAPLQFSPAAGVPANSYDWVTGAPETDDLVFTGAATVDLYFGVGVDVQSVTTVSLIALAADGTERTLGSDTDNTAAQAAAHTERFTMDLSGLVLLEGEAILLRVSVTEAAVLAQMLYGGADAPSGITVLPAQILDTDGDGVGDSAERRAGTDPTVADPSGGTDPGTTTNGTENPSGGNAGGVEPNQNNGGAESEDSDRPVEPLLATLLLLICLALAGFALLRRFSL